MRRSTESLRNLFARRRHCGTEGPEPVSAGTPTSRVDARVAASARAVVEAMEPRQLLSASALITHTSSNTADTITIKEGQAIHVHALGSFTGGTATADQMASRIEWNFDDKVGKYNNLVGFNAAHVYDTAGTYAVTLKVTDPAGAVTTDTLTVTVNANNNRNVGRVIYVNAAGGAGGSGNDANTGLSTAQAVATVERANDIIAALASKDDVSILFMRGDTFDYHESVNAANNNVRIGSYGTGTDPNPVLRWDTNVAGDFISLSSAKSHTLIEDVSLDLAAGVDRRVGVYAFGNDTVVRNVDFVRVSSAVESVPTTDRLLAIDNESTADNSVSRYGFWLQNNDAVYLGNKILNSIGEHAMRGTHMNRVLVSQNDLRNPYVPAVGDSTVKGVIEIQGGTDVYVVGNTATNSDGAGLRAGPNQLNMSDIPANRVVFEGNRLIEAGVNVNMATSDLVFRSNYIRTPGTAFKISGAFTNIDILNNTQVNTSATTNGDFLVIQDEGSNVRVLNNLQVAPQRNSGRGIWVEGGDGGMANFTAVDRNVFATRTDGKAYHRVENVDYQQGSGASPNFDSIVPTGNKNAWASATAVGMSGVDPAYAFPATGWDATDATGTVEGTRYGVAVAGVARDVYGRPFATSGRSVGAAEAAAPATSKIEAEAYDAQTGTTVRYGVSGPAVGSNDTGDQLRYSKVDFGTGVNRFTASVAVDPAFAGRTFNLRIGHPTTGTLIGTFTPTSTGGWNTFQEQTVTLSNPSAAVGVQDLYIVPAQNGPGNLDYFTFSNVSAVSFTSTDIGSSVAAGSTTEVTANEDYNITGGGTDVTGSADSFRFVHTQLTGDFDIKVRINSLPNTVSHWSKVGLMARSSLNANSANAFMMGTPGGNDMWFQNRTTDGGSTSGTSTNTPGNYPNQWVRLTRVGNVFTGYVSTDGVNWGTAVGSATISTAPSMMYVGLAVCAHGDGTSLLPVQFRDMEIA